MHIDHIEIRYDTLKIKITISKFDTIQYKFNFLFRNFDTIRNISKLDPIQNLKQVKEEEKEEKERQTDRQVHMSESHIKIV